VLHVQISILAYVSWLIYKKWLVAIRAVFTVFTVYTTVGSLVKLALWLCVRAGTGAAMTVVAFIKKI
jgi:hypothetical protein